MNNAADQNSSNQNAAVSPKPWFNFGPRMSKARLIVVLVGTVLPYAARIPGIATHGGTWFTDYLGDSWRAALFIGMFNVACWGSILLATLTYRDVRSVWFPAVIGFADLAYWHGTLNLSASSTAAVALMFIPFMTLPYVGVGWLVGLVFDRLIFKSPTAAENGDTGQFRLRSLMLVTAAVAALCGLVTWQWRSVKANARNAVRQSVLDGQIDPEQARPTLGDEVDSLKAELEKKKQQTATP